jgi:phosphatidylinositol alpha-mannosyltransferase
MPRPSKLTIGFVFDDSLDKPDGVQQYVLTLGDWMKKQGHSVHYLVGATTRDDIANVHSLSRNMRVAFNGNRMSVPLPSNRVPIKTVLDQQKFDVLHIQIPYSPWLAGRIIQAAPDTTVVVGTFHIAPYSRLVTIATKGLAIWARRTTARFDKILSVSQAAQVYAQDTFGIATDILPNVIEYKRFSSVPKTAHKPLRILFLGRLVERKGCQYLLEAITLLKASGRTLPDFEVVIGGKGGLSDTLKRYVTDHDLASCVTFLGFVDEADKPALYASADIAVFPSTGGESFGIVLIEAMASGASAVLAADNPGYHSVMENSPDLLFATKSADALAEKLYMYLTDDRARRAAQKWAHREAMQYDVAIVGTKLVNYYTEALHSRRLS